MSPVLVNQEVQIPPVTPASLDAAAVQRATRLSLELESLCKALEVKAITPNHVKYAWSKSLTEPLKKKVQKGGETLPSEYFGIPSGAFHPKAEVAKLETRIDVTPDHSRPEIPYRAAGGGSSSSLISSDNLVKFVADRVSAKLSAASKKTLHELSEAHANNIVKKFENAKKAPKASVLLVASSI